MQRTAGNKAVASLLKHGFSLSGVLSDSGGPPLHDAGGGVTIGAGGTELAEPGISSQEADEQIASGQLPDGATPVTAGDSGSATGQVQPAATLDEAEPQAGGPPAAGNGAAAAPLAITSRTDMHAPDGTPDDRTTLGMGEVVYFSAGDKPLDWTASSGWPTRREQRSTFAWELPDPGQATITATDPGTGASASIDMKAISPNSLRMVKTSEPAVAPAGAQMIQDPRFGPRNVSFGNVEWLEVAQPASGVSGYFSTLAASGVDLSHHPNPNFLRVAPGLNDTAGIWGLPAPYSAGSFFWNIPNRFRRAGTGGQGQVDVVSTQHFQIDATGKVTVRKQGASVTKP